MGGFTRRFAAYPGNGVISQIEGVDIIDTPASGNFQGVGEGTVAMVGEFADVSSGVAVDSNGNVTTRPQPIEIMSSKDLTDKVGGFDETIGDFGRAGGNGFVSLRNKKFSTLIVVPINTASSKGVRLVRDLPTCVGATDPTAIVPIQPGTISAGREFKSGANRVRLAILAQLASYLEMVSGIDAAVGGTSAAYQTLVSAGSDFVACSRPDGTSSGVKKGDAVVLGALGATGLSAPVNATFTLTTGTLTTATYYYRVSALNSVGETLASTETSLGITGPAGVNVNWAAVSGATGYKVYGRSTGAELLMATVAAGILTWHDDGSITPSGAMPAADTTAAALTNADTYRVRSVTDLHTITVEKQDGTNFALVASSALPFRIHPGSTADSSIAVAGAAAADITGYTLPARPLDATIVATATPAPLAPTVVPTASSASAWDPLSGLELLIMPGVATGDLVYAAAVQAANAANSSALDALYASAFDALLGDDYPQNTVNVVYSSRVSATIRAKERQHAIAASANGLGRIACISPQLTTTETLAVGTADPGVGATRAENVIYNFPGLRTYVPEAVGYALQGADGITHTDGMIDTTSDGWMASILSVLPPERDPGQSASPVSDVMVNVIAFQRGLTAAFGLSDYILFKSRGVSAPRYDSDIGWFTFQSGITSSVTPGQTDINRRRFSYFVEDSLAAILKPFAKEPLTRQNRDNETGEVTAFVEQLLSPNNLTQQRIQAYLVDDVSGNTSAQLAAGIYIILATVQMVPIQKQIVIVCRVSPDGLTVTAS